MEWTYGFFISLKGFVKLASSQAYHSFNYKHLPVPEKNMRIPREERQNSLVADPPMNI